VDLSEIPRVEMVMYVTIALARAGNSVLELRLLLANVDFHFCEISLAEVFDEIAKNLQTTVHLPPGGVGVGLGQEILENVVHDFAQFWD
jgi:hypothetical protein